jgi:DNA polymerase III sliding clamp (beta) subunit (PCNA family)
VCLDFSKDVFCHVVGTDGQRMTFSRIDGTVDDDFKGQILLDYEDTKSLIAILKKDQRIDYPVDLKVDNSGAVNFQLMMNKVHVRTVDEVYPPWSEILKHVPKNKKGASLHGVNPFFLQDAIKAFGFTRKDTPRLDILVGKELEPIKLTSPKRPELTVLIMPMRV